MGKLSARNKGVKRTVKMGNMSPAAMSGVDDLDGRIEAIQLLIPLGLQAVAEELERAVVELAGERYQRKAADQPLRRWGAQRGSVYLGDQKLPVDVPRVRNVDDDSEIPLAAYQTLQAPRNLDEGLLRRMLKGIATRNYEACAETVPQTFGLSASTVSRRYVKATARKLAHFQERSLADYDLVAVARASPTNRSSSLWVSPSMARRSLWVSCRQRPKTSVSAVASWPTWWIVACSMKRDCWSSSTVPRGCIKR